MRKQELLWDISNIQTGQPQNILNKLHQKFKEKAQIGKENEYMHKAKPKPKINNDSINNLYFAETTVKPIQHPKSRCSKLQIAITDTNYTTAQSTTKNNKTPICFQGRIIEAMLQSSDFVTHRSPSSKARSSKFGFTSTKSAMHSKLGVYPQTSKDCVGNMCQEAAELKSAKQLKCSILKSGNLEVLIIKGHVDHSYFS